MAVGAACQLMIGHAVANPSGLPTLPDPCFSTLHLITKPRRLLKKRRKSRVLRAARQLLHAQPPQRLQLPVNVPLHKLLQHALRVARFPALVTQFMSPRARIETKLASKLLEPLAFIGPAKPSRIARSARALSC